MTTGRWTRGGRQVALRCSGFFVENKNKKRTALHLPQRNRKVEGSGSAKVLRAFHRGTGSRRDTD